MSTSITVGFTVEKKKYYYFIDNINNHFKYFFPITVSSFLQVKLLRNMDNVFLGKHGSIPPTQQKKKCNKLKPVPLHYHNSNLSATIS